MIAAAALAVGAWRRLRSSNRHGSVPSIGASDPGGAHDVDNPSDPRPGGRPGSRTRSVIRRYPVGTFLLLAFVGMWIPLTATLVAGLPVRLTSAVGALLGLAAPALLVTGVLRGRPAVRSLLRRCVIPTPSPLTFAVALAAIPATTAALGLAVRQGGVPATTDVVSIAARFALDLVIALLTIQIAEELGWTGLAQDVLQQRHGALRAAVLVAPAFAAIHLPTYLVGAPVTPMALAGALLQLVLVTAFAIAFRILIAWSYNASGGCVLAAAVMHASFNTASGGQFLGHFGSGPVIALLPLVAVVLLAGTVTLAGRGRLALRRPIPPRANGAS